MILVLLIVHTTSTKQGVGLLDGAANTIALGSNQDTFQDSHGLMC
jgi:hypothetical protein